MEPPVKTRKPRKDSAYTVEERTLMNQYKQKYMTQPTRELRANVIRNEILPDLYNYWVKLGTAPQSGEESLALAAWVRNNWRPGTAANEYKSSIRVTSIEMVWQTRRSEVEDEMRKRLGSDDLDPASAAYFKQRVPAAKVVLDRMTELELAQLAALIEQRKCEGHPPDVQRKRAHKYRLRDVRNWSKDQWLDKGMATVIFTVHTDLQGRLAGDVHDDIADNMGFRNKRSFEDTHEDKVKEVTRALVSYVKSLRDSGGNTGGQHIGIGTDPLELSLDANGYPLLPSDIVQKSRSKRELEDIMRTYLGQHYYLASGHRTRHLPYQLLSKRTSSFISKDYFPKGLKITDPRNMHKENVQSLLGHIFERQSTHGPASAFRFKNIVKGQDQTLIKAIYPDENTPKAQRKRNTSRGNNAGPDPTHPTIPANAPSSTGNNAGPDSPHLTDRANLPSQSISTSRGDSAGPDPTHLTVPANAPTSTGNNASPDSPHLTDRANLPSQSICTSRGDNAGPDPTHLTPANAPTPTGNNAGPDPTHPANAPTSRGNAGPDPTHPATSRGNNADPDPTHLTVPANAPTSTGNNAGPDSPHLNVPEPVSAQCQVPTKLGQDKPHQLIKKGKQRKPVNSDALAAEEAKRLGITASGSGQKRTRVRRG